MKINRRPLKLTKAITFANINAWPIYSCIYKSVVVFCWWSCLPGRLAHIYSYRINFSYSLYSTTTPYHRTSYLIIWIKYREKNMFSMLLLLSTNIDENGCRNFLRNESELPVQLCQNYQKIIAQQSQKVFVNLYMWNCSSFFLCVRNMIYRDHVFHFYTVNIYLNENDKVIKINVILTKYLI